MNNFNRFSKESVKDTYENTKVLFSEEPVFEKPSNVQQEDTTKTITDVSINSNIVKSDSQINVSYN